MAIAYKLDASIIVRSWDSNEHSSKTLRWWLWGMGL